ncbi:MAG: protein-L-isoaspartate(D-aspartate) O-methyltransferase [Burkholderiaceae bacterium]|nr:protein-L-isoaspartate(D-aspartate) O-methyltransferase [Burkholderiaceae bacterium]
MSEGNGQPKKRFPLTLDLVTGLAGRRKADAAALNSRQTATQNAARHASSGRPLTAASRVHEMKPPPPAIDRMANMPLVSEAVRKAMVQRVAQQGVRDPLVLAALEQVPRHYFLEPGLAPQAYVDASLPIGYHQTISQPYIVARMIEVMREGVAGKLGRVLEIGTGCGYQAAVLAEVADEVYSIERIRPLHERARANLRPLRIPNLRLHYGDGMLGLPQCGPFDGIILAAAGLDVPQALFDQMAIGGRLVAPVGAGEQRLKLIVRTRRNEWIADMLEPCHFVPLRPGTFG